MSYVAPEWLVWVLVAFGLIMAGGLTYHTERRRADRLSDRLSVVTSDQPTFFEMAQYHDTRSKMAHATGVGSQLLHWRVTEENFEEWKASVQTWATDVGGWVAGTFSATAANRFSQALFKTTRQWENSVNDEHDHLLQILYTRIDVLYELDKRYLD